MQSLQDLQSRLSHRQHPSSSGPSPMAMPSNCWSSGKLLLWALICKQQVWPLLIFGSRKREESGQLNRQCPSWKKHKDFCQPYMIETKLTAGTLKANLTQLISRSDLILIARSLKTQYSRLQDWPALQSSARREIGISSQDILQINPRRNVCRNICGGLVIGDSPKMCSSSALQIASSRGRIGCRPHLCDDKGAQRGASSGRDCGRW